MPKTYDLDDLNRVVAHLCALRDAVQSAGQDALRQRADEALEILLQRPISTLEGQCEVNHA